MITIHSLKEIPPLALPIALTIGTFDGMHEGHRFLFKELKKRGTAVALTFSNHPSEVLSGTAPTLLCPLDERLKRMEATGLDLAIVLSFTHELSREPYDVFLRKVKDLLPFSFLILGKGAAFGKGNLGNEARIKTLQNDLDFQALYLNKQTRENQPISSQRIRNLIADGEQQKAKSLL